MEIKLIMNDSIQSPDSALTANMTDHNVGRHGETSLFDYKFVMNTADN